ncbi:MAG: nucleotidyltransferase family protein [Myxococcota bacterium]
MPERARLVEIMAAQPADPVWEALRALLRGQPLAEGVPIDALVDAAARGHVMALMASLRPELARRLSRELAAESFVQLHITRAQGELAELLSLAGLKRRPVLLKGNATAHLIYETPALRATLDVDLLVAEGDFEAALGALHAAGWLDAAPEIFQAVNRSDAYEHPLARDIGPVRVGCDLHRRLARGQRFRIDHTAILDRALTLPGVPLPVCHPEDALLHTALHAATSHFAVPLKAWVDLHRLCEHPEVDLDRTAERARAQQMASALWAGLHVVSRWFGTTLDPRVMASLRPDGGRARALEWLLAGNGATPLRQALSSRETKLLIGPLVADKLSARGAWVVETFQLVSRGRLARRRRSVTGAVGPD